VIANPTTSSCVTMSLSVPSYSLSLVFFLPFCTPTKESLYIYYILYLMSSMSVSSQQLQFITSLSTLTVSWLSIIDISFQLFVFFLSQQIHPHIQASRLLCVSLSTLKNIETSNICGFKTWKFTDFCNVGTNKKQEKVYFLELICLSKCSRWNLRWVPQTYHYFLCKSNFFNSHSESGVHTGYSRHFVHF
jgi:hypothetical protein